MKIPDIYNFRNNPHFAHLFDEQGNLVKQNEVKPEPLEESATEAFRRAVQEEGYWK